MLGAIMKHKLPTLAILALLPTLLACATGTGSEATRTNPAEDAAGTAATMEEESYVEVGEARSGEPVRLYHRILGNGPEIVIKPNAVQTGDEIERLVEGRRIVLYDARGRGRSTHYSEDLPVGMEIDLEDLEALRRHLGAETVSLMGGSYYGSLVARYAARYPEHVNKVVLLGPMTIDQETWAKFQMDRLGGEVNQALTELLRRGPRDGNLEAFCHEYYRIAAKNLFADPELAAAYEPDYCDLPNEQPPSFLDWIGDLFETIENWDFRDEAAKIEAPVLVIQGLQDAQVPPKGGQVWAETIPNARLVEVPETGHLPLEESPDVVVPEIEEFLAEE